MNLLEGADTIIVPETDDGRLSIERMEEAALAAAKIPDQRKTMYAPGEVVPHDAFTVSRPGGRTEVLYRPSSPKHMLYHASSVPKLIMEGRRGTGKSHTMRWDFHIRAKAYPGYKYLIMRRTMPELRKSHLLFLETDMDKLGGRALGVRSGNVEAHYPNGSLGLFGHCETEADVLKYLSAQFDGICFDEITTFDWDMVTRISTSCRVLEGSGLTAIVRGGTNPLGVSADEVYHYFIAKDLTTEEDPTYDKRDWDSLHIERSDSAHIDYVQYDKQFAGLSKAYREAWLEGKWGVEGAYFTIEPKHIIKAIPFIFGSDGLPAMNARLWPWLNIYRMLDYGWHDPSVCIWVAVLPDGREIAFQEYSVVRTPAQTVALDLKRLSEGMRIVGTFADPTLWDGEKEMGHCMANVFEDEGVPLIKGRNDRVAAGFSIQEHLNTNVRIGRGEGAYEEPKLQIIEDACPTLLKTLRSMRVDKKHPGRIADHKADHMPIALGYFAMSNVGPTQIPAHSTDRPWMVKTSGGRKVMGSSNVRRRAHSVYES